MGAPEAPRNRPRRPRRARASARDSRRGRVPLRHPRGLRGAWSPTALPRWRPPAAPRSRSWTPACPSRRPVSGIAMGLIKEGDDVVILSDIQGLEDFLGDMDFKVCGTSKGITALQMDNKAKGLSVDILARALKQAHEGRAFILSAMLEKHAPRPRAELSRHRAAHRDHPHPRRQDPRRHRLRRQGRPRHPGGDGRLHRHPGRRHHPHRRRRGHRPARPPRP